jgi:hypothetical protein
MKRRRVASVVPEKAARNDAADNDDERRDDGDEEHVHSPCAVALADDTIALRPAARYPHKKKRRWCRRPTF